VTNLACLEIVKDGFLLLERAPGISVKEIVAATQGNLIVPKDVPEMML
ncbi:MAG: succinyl-CoA--3-ketoacid-CoA transferase, partial [Candidatus Arcticimaribacter sp.]